jgi:hypothetical protein
MYAHSIYNHTHDIIFDIAHTKIYKFNMYYAYNMIHQFDAIPYYSSVSDSWTRDWHVS